MGRAHAGIYAAMPDAEVVAICDTNIEAAEEVAGLYSAAAFAKFAEMLAGAEFDVVDVCVPTPSHLEHIKAAAESGKHVCCEKPLARTTVEAHEAVRVCREAGVTLFPAHVLRWFPEYRKLHDLVQSGAVGNPVTVRTSRGGAQPLGSDGWYADYKRSGGAVLDLLIHDFDWLRWTFGRAREVYARGMYESKVPMTDYALVTIRFESGAIAHVEGSWARPGGLHTSVEIAGTTGLLSVSSADSTSLTIELKTEGESAAGSVVVPESPLLRNPYREELEHFINCLETGRTPDVTPEDGFEAVRMAEAALRSITTHHPVVLA